MRVFFLDDVDSTQDEAKSRSGKLPEEELVLVIAQVQRRGRGRYGRHWVSPRGGLWMTLSISSSLIPIPENLFPLWVGLSVLEVLNLKEIGLAFPNDIYLSYGEKLGKVGGVLIESFNSSYKGRSYRRFLVGIGLNLNISAERMRLVRRYNPRGGRIRGLWIDSKFRITNKENRPC